MLVQIIQKVVLKMIHLDYRNGFSVTVGLISFMWVKNGSPTSTEKDSIQISVSWFLASKSIHSQETKVFSLTYVDIQSHISL